MKHLLLLVCLSFTLLANAQYKLYPRNEVYKDSSLTDFICKLQYAIFLKDRNFLLSAVDKNIRNGFGDDNGIENFKKIWQIDQPNSTVWFYLSKLISLGGVFSGTGNPSNKSFVFPYVAEMEVTNDTLNSSYLMAITSNNVNVREKPDKTSRIVGQLTYDIIAVNFERSYPPSNKKEWYYITTIDKKISGYVFREYIWSPIDYRMFLEKLNGQWKITALLAGD